MGEGDEESIVTVTAHLETVDFLELGANAVWSLSTAKPGNGVEQLRDEDKATFWQSDGVQPHVINIQFLRKVDLAQVSLYVDYTTDESYTPKKVSVRAGTCIHDLIDVAVVELNEPIGWVNMDVQQMEETTGSSENSLPTKIKYPLRCHFLQIKIMVMHQNGRDTHVRQVKVFGRRRAAHEMPVLALNNLYSTIEMTQFAAMR